LKIKHKYNFNTGDYGYLYYSLDNNNWIQVDQYSGFSANGDWEEREYYVGELKNVSATTPVYLRFQLHSDGNNINDGWYVDDVSIAQSSHGAGIFPLSLDMEDGSAVDNKLLMGGVKRVNVGGNAHSGDYVLESKSPYNHFVYSSNTMNIISASNPYISFWYKGNNGGGARYITAEASSDAGMTWNHLGNVHGNGSTWQRIQYDLTNYKSNQFMIRLKFSSDYGHSTYIDDLFIGNMIRQLAPQNNLTNQAYKDLPFSWTSSTTSSKYHFQLSKTSNFSTIEKEDTTLTIPNFTVDSLDYNTKYYWRVRGLNEETSWTSTWNFTTRDTNAVYKPKMPYIVSPLSGSAGLDTVSTFFNWRKVDSANTYRIQISLSLLFDSFVVDQNVTDTSYTATNLLRAGTTYFWRVRAQGAADTSYFTYPSAFATFGVGGSPAVPVKEIDTKLYMHGNWNGTTHNAIPVSCEIRTGTDLMTSTLVKRVGGVVGTDGKTTFDFGNAADGTYWIVVRAAGYMPLGSTGQVTLSTTKATYDFTTGLGQAAGGSRVLYDDGTYLLMRGGDFNFDRRSSATDIPVMSTSFGQNAKSYVPAP
jgi:hypothetical protein